MATPQPGSPGKNSKKFRKAIVDLAHLVADFFKSRMATPTCMLALILSLVAAVIGLLAYWQHLDWLHHIPQFIMAALAVHIVYDIGLQYAFIRETDDRLRKITIEAIDGLATTAANCIKIGVGGIHMKDTHPFNEETCDSLQNGDRVFCVGRTLCKLLQLQQDRIADALVRGVDFELGICDYKYCLTGHVRELTQAQAVDYSQVFLSLERIHAKVSRQPSAKVGKLSVFQHNVYLSDTLIVLSTGCSEVEKHKVYWIPYFGRQDDDKLTVQFVEGQSGKRYDTLVKERFEKILNRKEPFCIIGNGASANATPARLKQEFEEWYRIHGCASGESASTTPN